MDLDDDSVDGVVCRWGYMLMATRRQLWLRRDGSCVTTGPSRSLFGKRRTGILGRRSQA